MPKTSTTKPPPYSPLVASSLVSVSETWRYAPAFAPGWFAPINPRPTLRTFELTTENEYERRTLALSDADARELHRRLGEIFHVAENEQTRRRPVRRKGNREPAR